jgi:type II secretory pathway pseudopilin PulG
MIDLQPRDRDATERGFALVAVLFVAAVFFVLAGALLFQSRTQQLVAVNEQDHVLALGYAEAGLSWARRRIADETNFSSLLDGPTGGSGDDYLLGLRDLSLISTAAFTALNESTKSAIVTRDFGSGSKSWEVVRVAGETSDLRAHIYVRVDDNYDDAPTNPASNVPLVDTDGRIKATVVAEYPVFVNGAGVEILSNLEARGRARRTLVGSFFGDSSSMPAVSSEGDIELHSSTDACGDCGDVHSNEDLTLNGDACQAASAVGTLTGGGSAASKTAGAAAMDLPIINPYDDVFVPLPEHFDTTGQVVSCGAPSASDPGRSKYFTLVAYGGKGHVYKGYYDFTNSRWAWRLIADLNDGSPDEKLDRCGRTNDDPGYGTLIDDGKTDEFYGWKNANDLQNLDCPGSGCSGDASLCTLSNNDFTQNGYYAATAANDGQGATTVQTHSETLLGGNVAFPGSGAGDGTADWYPNSTVKDGKWEYSSDDKWDPTWNAVIFVVGSVYVGGNPGGSVADKVWPVSIIAYGDIEISGNPNLGPANPIGGYYNMLVSGRDIKLNGNFNDPDHPSCTGSCPGTVPSDIAKLGGFIAAHEQIEISGNPNIFGIVYAEDAIACSPMNSAGFGIMTGADTDVLYDCVHPPNPFGSGAPALTMAWQEVE